MAEGKSWNRIANTTDLIDTYMHFDTLITKRQPPRQD